MMKNLVSVFFTVVVFTLGVISCDDATDTTEGYTKALFTIGNNTVFPEMVDTFYVVNNIETMGLKNGDRALLRLDYFVDNVVGMKGAKYEIGEVYEVYPVYDIVDANSIDRNEYTSALTGLISSSYGAVWAWNGYQNLNVVYKNDGTEPEFKMVMTGYDNDTLRLSLLSKMTEGEKENAKFICFDLKSVVPMLNTEQLNKILNADTLNTKITMNHFDSQEETVIERTIIGGKIANPFK